MVARKAGIFAELIDRRIVLLELQEHGGAEKERELAEVEKLLEDLRNDEEAQRREERRKIMEEAIRRELWLDLQYFAREAEREAKKGHPYIISREYGDMLFRYLKTLYPSAAVITYMDAKWILLNEKQKKNAHVMLETAMEKRIAEQLELQKALDEARMLVGENYAYTRRDNQKTT